MKKAAGEGRLTSLPEGMPCALTPSPYPLPAFLVVSGHFPATFLIIPRSFPGNQPIPGFSIFVATSSHSVIPIFY